ncbi:hypothetical protein [Hahella ganghwensis]|uniref:hypothetical protein n=1 Tax=Hahella ganghwensis TaxID=286420 RepID=UPI000380B80F|nr:hypothetical protein [Hahella ganghwensis]
MRQLSRFLFLVLFLHLCFTPVHATDINDLAPHQPTGDQWSEQWFYNLNDPENGYFKVSLQTYISPDSPSQLRGYVHFARADRNGLTTTYDYFSDDVVVEKVSGNQGDSFRFQIPGVVDADENSLQLSLPEVQFQMSWVGIHTPYWQLVNQAQSPFGILSEFPGVGADWFIWTMKTPTQYSYADDNHQFSGYGYTNVDKGWSDKEAYGSYIYAMTVSESYQFMLSGGSPKSSSIEMWAGQFRAPGETITFLPKFKGLGVKRWFNACEGSFSFELTKPGRKVILEAQSNPQSYYDATVPSQVVFGAEKPIMKTMQARFHLKIYHWGTLVEETTIPQGLLEFAGDAYCDE